MTLETGVKELAEAVGADVKALDSGKVNSNDPRLTDSREWSAATVPQEEAEAGEASTRRAWTSQRVRQAIVGWWQLVTSGFGRNFIAATNEQAARNVLQLGTAATRDVLDDPSSANLSLLLTGNSYGLGGSTLDSERTPTGFARSLRTKKFAMAATNYEIASPMPTGMAIGNGGTEFSSNYTGLYVGLSVRRAFVYNLPAGETNPVWAEMYTTINTTKNPDGTLKASSPVINLYTDHHDLHNEEQFGATPVVTRKSKGVYEITGTLGLRSEGWYLDTPSDRNGNKYFNVEWTQNITPDAVDGVVNEYRDDIVVTVETFERVWNKETGIFENGAPIDINEPQDRFVQLRFNEVKVEHEELDDEAITRNQE